MGDDDKDAFYIVRKGDNVGVYKNMNDLQSVLQDVNDPSSVSIFRGYGLSKEAEKYLSSHGLKNAIYSIDARLVRDDLFGQLTVCPLREPNSSNKSSGKSSIEKRPQDLVGSASFAANPQLKNAKLDSFLQGLPMSSYRNACIIEFDGASKGNPGPSGAGAVLRSIDGTMVLVRLREGVGFATNNVAEYRGCILGLKYALQKGFKYISIQGDSKLVCMQVQGIWKTKVQNMAELCKVAKELKDQFLLCQICHIDREYNTEADAQANLGVHLKSGVVEVECDVK